MDLYAQVEVYFVISSHREGTILYPIANGFSIAKTFFSGLF